jgi:uncharacterized membrane protein
MVCVVDGVRGSLGTVSTGSTKSGSRRESSEVGRTCQCDIHRSVSASDPVWEHADVLVREIATAQAIYVAVFGYETAAGIPDFARRVLTTPQGWWLIVVGCGVGFLFALVALCISVVSFPMMLDRHGNAGEAMVTSLRVVARNPAPMAAWGLLVAVLLVLGSLPFFLGLAIVIPLLGHATRHLYRATIRSRCRLARRGCASPPPISQPICSPGGAGIAPKALAVSQTIATNRRPMLIGRRLYSGPVSAG